MSKPAPTNLVRDIDCFYVLLDELAQRVGGWRQLGLCSRQMVWPRRGVYFLREPGEYRTANQTEQRVVRVGTHALKAGSRSTLLGRLQQHRGTGSGFGNHRGSVFRLHVGAALLSKHDEQGQYPDWGRGANASPEVREYERPWEAKVSHYLGQMDVLCLAVDDEPASDSDRGKIERNAISLLSCLRSCCDDPSHAWLGHHSPNLAIRRSGLWNVNHVLDQYDGAFLDLMAAYVSVVE